MSFAQALVCAAAWRAVFCSAWSISSAWSRFARGREPWGRTAVHQVGARPGFQGLDTAREIAGCVMWRNWAEQLKLRRFCKDFSSSHLVSIGNIIRLETLRTSTRPLGPAREASHNVGLQPRDRAPRQHLSGYRHLRTCSKLLCCCRAASAMQGLGMQLHPRTLVRRCCSPMAMQQIGRPLARGCVNQQRDSERVLTTVFRTALTCPPLPQGQHPVRCV